MYQHTSLVYTDAPLRIKKLFKQQLRWARGSQYNTLRMLPWMLGHAPVLALFFVMDIILPFLLAGVVGGWIYRAFTGQGYNFYEGILKEYGVQSGVALVIGLMTVSSVLSMAIRQIRHLSEKPSDFFRLPIFIIVSTAFLMPVRLIGFFRMGHASGWGTRAGAYGGGSSNDSLMEELGDAKLADTTEYLDELVLDYRPLSTSSHTSTMLEASPRRAAQTRVAAPQAPKRRRLNPKAAWPYVIGITIFALEAFFIVSG